MDRGFFVLYPFYISEIQLIAGEAPDGGVEELVSAKFGRDAVKEGKTGRTVVSGTSVKSHSFCGIVLIVPASSMYLHVALHKVLVLEYHSIHKSACEGPFRLRYQYEFRMHRKKLTR